MNVFTSTVGGAVKITHAQFQYSIVDLAQRLGYEFIYHTWNSRNSPAGFPDLILLREGRMIVAELKIPPDTLKPEQYFWLLEFLTVTEDVYLWESTDDFDEIAKILVPKR